MTTTVVETKKLSPQARKAKRLYEMKRNPATGRPYTLEEIGKELGVARQRVHQILRKADVEFRPTGPFIDRERIRALAQAKDASIESVVEATGYGRSTVVAELKAAGLLKALRKRVRKQRAAEHEAALVADLKRLARKLGHTPSYSEIPQTGRSLRQYVTAFGSVMAAQEAAGLPTRSSE